MKTEIITIEMPKKCNVIIGMSHFIKTVEDLYETMVNCVPGIKFGIAFCESSGERLVRIEGNDSELKDAAGENMLRLGCGHSFVVIIGNAYPINVLNAVKGIPEVCTIYAATANPLQVIVADTDQGRGILGVIDGQKPIGIENEKNAESRKRILREMGYKK